MIENVILWIGLLFLSGLSRRHSSWRNMLIIKYKTSIQLENGMISTFFQGFIYSPGTDVTYGKFLAPAFTLIMLSRNWKSHCFFYHRISVLKRSQWLLLTLMSRGPGSAHAKCAAAISCAAASAAHRAQTEGVCHKPPDVRRKMELLPGLFSHVVAKSSLPGDLAAFWGKNTSQLLSPLWTCLVSACAGIDARTVI